MYRSFVSLLVTIIAVAISNYAHSFHLLFKEVDLDQVATDLEKKLLEEVNYELSQMSDAETKNPPGMLSGGLRPIGLTTEFIKPKGTLYDIFQVEIDESTIASGPWFNYDLTFYIRQETPFARTIVVHTNCSTRPKIPSGGMSIGNIKANCTLPSEGRVHESLIDAVSTAANRLNTALSASYIERFSIDDSKSFLACSKRNALFSSFCELDESAATFSRKFPKYVDGTDISVALCDEKYEYVHRYLLPVIGTKIQWSNSAVCKPVFSSSVSFNLGNEDVLVSRGYSNQEFDVAEYDVTVDDNLDRLCRNQDNNLVYAFPFSMSVFKKPEINKTIHGSCDLTVQARLFFSSQAAAEGMALIEQETNDLMTSIQNRKKDHLHLLQISSPALCNAVDRVNTIRRIIAEFYENGVIENVSIDDLGPYGVYFAIYESEIRPLLAEAMENEEMPFIEEPWDYFLINYDSIVQICGSEIDLEIDEALEMAENEFFEALGHLPNYEKQRLWENLLEYRDLVAKRNELKIQYETLQALSDATPRPLPLGMIL